MHLAGSAAFSFLLEFTTLCYNMIVLLSLFFYTQGGSSVKVTANLFIVSFFNCLIIPTESSGGEVGLAITQCMSLLGMMQWGIRQSTEVANNMMATERIIEYVQIPPEQKQLAKERQLATGWPEKGYVKLDHVYLKYSEDDDPVLCDLNIVIHPGEKVIDHVSIIIFLTNITLSKLISHRLALLVELVLESHH